MQTTPEEVIRQSSDDDDDDLIHLEVISGSDRALCGVELYGPVMPFEHGPHDCQTCWFLNDLEQEIWG